MPTTRNEETESLARQFAERFTRFRKRIGLDEATMAKELNVSYRTLQRWSAGGTPPRFAHLVQIYKLAEKFGLWPELFLNSRKVAIPRSVQESLADLQEGRYFLRVRLRKEGSRAELLRDLMGVIIDHDGELCRINGPLASSVPETEVIGISIHLPDAQKLDFLMEDMGKLPAVLSVAHPDEQAKTAYRIETAESPVLV